MLHSIEEADALRSSIEELGFVITNSDVPSHFRGGQQVDAQLGSIDILSGATFELRRTPDGQWALTVYNVHGQTPLSWDSLAPDQVLAHLEQYAPGR